MRSVIRRLLDPKQANIPVKHFILPTFPDQGPDVNEKIGVGIWPDRLILTDPGNGFEALQQAAKATIKDLADLTFKELIRTDKAAYLKKNFAFEAPATAQAIEDHFRAYFRLAMLEVDEKDLPEAGDSFVKKVNALLDHLELAPVLAPLDPDYVAILLRAAHRSFLIKDAFHQRWKFESLVEVATADLRQVNPARYETIVQEDFEQKDSPGHSEEDDLLDLLGREPDFRPFMSNYHRYIAIVHADGDRIGALLGKLGNNQDDVKEFSRRLYDFGKQANHILGGDRYAANPTSYGHGAAPLYLGGDDLVFFAPVARRDAVTGKLTTIFDCLQELDIAFGTLFSPYAAKGVVPTLSYGVSITYFKYPLQEALAVSRDLLNAVKEDTPVYKTRNRIHFRVLKHSGQHFGAVIDKNDHCLYHQWFEVLNARLDTVNDRRKEKANLLAGVAHKLDRLQPLLIPAIQREGDAKRANEPDYASLIDPLFKNQFNEKVHRNPRDKDRLNDFLEQLKQFIALSRGSKDAPDLDLAYALLRFIHFLNAREHD